MARYRYPGLKSFETEDHDVFFGRGQDIDRLNEMISTENLIVFFSKSGLGKSSLINAGIIPELKKELQNCPVSVRFTSHGEDSSMSPSDILITKLQQSLEKKINTAPTFLDSFIEPDNSLWYNLKKNDILAGERKTYVLFFDQFEEIFSYPHDEVNKFAIQIAELLNKSIPKKYRDALRHAGTSAPLNLKPEQIDLFYEPLKVKVLFIIRSDKLNLLTGLKNIIPHILSNTLELSALSEEKAENAIVLPAKKKSKIFKSDPFTFEPDALRKLLNYLTNNGTQKVESFQLQIVCQFIEEVLVIEEEKYVIKADHLGDISTLFENYYSKMIKEFPKEKRRIAQVFIEEGLIFEEDQRRVSIYEGRVKNYYKVDEEMLGVFLENRLIRQEPNPSGGNYYELCHDSLIEPILKFKARRTKRERELQAKIEQKEAIEMAALEERKKLEEQALKRFVDFEKARKARLAAFKKILTNDYASAHAYFERAKKIFEEYKNHENIIQIQLDLGRLYELENNFEAAEKIYKTALESTIDDEILISFSGVIQEHIAYLHEFTKGIDNSVEDYLLSQKYFANSEDQLGHGRVSERLALHFEEIEQLNKALRQYQKSSESYNIAGDLLGKIRINQKIKYLRSLNQPWGYLVRLDTNDLFELKQSSIEIGRDVPAEGLKNDVSFADRTISRQHLLIDKENYAAKDLRSLNGTCVNGIDLRYASVANLEDRDIIVLANTIAVQFFVNKPNLEIVQPKNTWGMLLNFQSKTFRFIHQDELYLELTDNNIVENDTKTHRSFVQIRKKPGDYQLYFLKSDWDILYYHKMNEYDYRPYFLKHNQWISYLSLPLHPVKLSDDQKTIVQQTTSFQVVPLFPYVPKEGE